MKLKVKVVAWSLSLLLAGCAHKTNQSRNQPLAPPVIDTSPAKPDNAPINLPPPVVTVPKTPTPTVTKGEPPPKQSTRRRKAKAAQPAAPPPAQEAANGGTPEVDAIGQLSTGEPPDLKKQTTDTISETERGLKELHRKLNDQEQKTSTQIQEFLKQARAALSTGDVDGAHTLALKAKVLLSELNQ